MIHFRKFAKITLVLVYLVIVAGAVVRMTGSGMGCPDWPKCFGYYVPPTDIATLQWQPNRVFKKGQVIIIDEALRIAKEDFTTSTTYDPENWEAYTKHDYSIFNVWHTWIEYINRLLGALAGLATLILGIWSFWFWNHKKSIPLLSWLVVFGMAFQAWLGATVVYSVLEPVKITLHMVMALVIVAMLLYIIFRAKEVSKEKNIPKTLINLLWLALTLTLVQIVLGTQVRQFIDDQIDIVGEQAKSLWLDNPNLQFYVHRTFSIAVLLLNGFLFYEIRRKKLSLNKINGVLFFIALEVFTGILMYYADFPFASQPLHLVLASVLFGVQFYLVLESSIKRRSNTVSTT